MFNSELMKFSTPGTETDAVWLLSGMPDRTVSVTAVLDDAVEKWPDRPALTFMDKTITYRELQKLVACAAAGFQSIGVQQGIHVGLYLPNTPHYIISFFGVLKAGGTVVNYSPLDTESVLMHKVEDSETDIMVTLDLSGLYPQMHKMLSTTRLKKIVVGTLAEMSAQPETTCATMNKNGLLALVEWDDAHLAFARLLDNDGVFSVYPFRDPATTLAVLQYTGGTTGVPKGAMLTHGNLIAATAQFRSIGEPGVIEEGQERLLVVLPLFHIFALSVNVLFGICIGAELVLHVRFELDAVLRAIKNQQITVFAGVPSMYTAILAKPGLDAQDLTSLTFCLSGGAPISVAQAQQFEQLSGCRLLEGWGMTETAAAGCFTRASGMQKAHSCGTALPGISLRLVDDSESADPVAQGQRGELCIKGPNVMSAYWHNPQATAEAMTPDGYFRTGDIALMDEDGYISIVDRCKDMILCGGFNVYPRIIESAIFEHPSVAEVAVIGVYDAYRGESPKAFITLKKGAEPLSLGQLSAFLKSRLGKHEMVYALEIRSDLPKTLVGKLAKKVLIDEEQVKRTNADH